MLDFNFEESTGHVALVEFRLWWIIIIDIPRYLQVSPHAHNHSLREEIYHVYVGAVPFIPSANDAKHNVR